MLLITPGGDSYLSSRSYSRRGYSVPRFYDDTYIPRYMPSKQFLDTSGEENAIRKNVNRELMLTSHFVDDAYDLASHSHRRDEEVLKHANQAIVDSEIYHNPRIAVASRRARSQPPQPLQVSPVFRARASVPPRGASPPPRSYVRRANREVVVVVRPRRASVAAEVDFRKPVTAGWRYSRGYYNPYANPWYRYLPRRNFYVDTPGGVDTRSHYMYGTSLAFPMYSRLYTPYLYQNGYDYILPPSSEKYTKARLRVLASPLPYKKKFARKAALVGSKVDVVLPNNKRPRSKYAAAVIREINLKKHWGDEGHTEQAEMPTSHLHASPKPVTKSKDDDYKPMSDVRRRVRRVICKNRKDPRYFK